VPTRSDAEIVAPVAGKSAPIFANFATAAPSLALIVWAFRASPDWFDSHVLQNYCPLEPSTLTLETAARWTAVAIALVLATVVRSAFARWSARPRGPMFWRTTASAVGAAVLALALCDVSSASRNLDAGWRTNRACRRCASTKRATSFRFLCAPKTRTSKGG
jgi:hypothetical protein